MQGKCLTFNDIVNLFRYFLLIFQKYSHLTYFDNPYITPKVWISTLINKLKKLKYKEINCKKPLLFLLLI